MQDKENVKDLVVDLKNIEQIKIGVKAIVENTVLNDYLNLTEKEDLDYFFDIAKETHLLKYPEDTDTSTENFTNIITIYNIMMVEYVNNEEYEYAEVMKKYIDYESEMYKRSIAHHTLNKVNKNMDKLIEIIKDITFKNVTEKV